MRARELVVAVAAGFAFVVPPASAQIPPAGGTTTAADAAWQAALLQIYEIDGPVTLAEMKLQESSGSVAKIYACQQAKKADHALAAFRRKLTAASEARPPATDQGRSVAEYLMRVNHAASYAERIKKIREHACASGMS